MLMRCRWLELINTQVKPGEGVRCDWKRWRTDRPVTLPPPPGRRVPRRNSNTGEGGWAPWKLGALEAGDWQRLWGSFQGGSGDSGGHGGSGDSGEASRADPGTREAMADPGTLGKLPGQIRGLGRPWRIRGLWGSFQGGSGDSGGHGGSGDSGGHGGAGDSGPIFSGGQVVSGSSVALALGPATQAEDI